MKLLLAALRELNPNIASIDEQPIISASNKTVGWNQYFMDTSGQAIAGGTCADQETAKRIAVAECFERALFAKLISNPVDVKELLLDEVPSTSGFAAGFDKKSTAFRSICEALERWAWSKWIDDGFKIDELNQRPVLSALSQHLEAKFSTSFFLQRKLDVGIPFPAPTELYISIFLGFREKGVFAGSRVTSSNDDPWEHAIIEAVRNLNNFELSKSHLIPPANIIAKRVNFFGSNSDEATRQISRANKTDWPVAKLRLHKEINTGIDGLYLYRSMCSDYLHWHLGGESRFVY